MDAEFYVNVEAKVGFRKDLKTGRLMLCIHVEEDGECIYYTEGNFTKDKWAQRFMQNTMQGKQKQVSNMRRPR